MARRQPSIVKEPLMATIRPPWMSVTCAFLRGRESRMGWARDGSGSGSMKRTVRSRGQVFEFVRPLRNHSKMHE